MTLVIRIVRLLATLATVSVQVESILPQVSQEGLLRPYRSYADVTLFHYHIPKETSRVTFEFAAFLDNSKCPQREVYVYLQHGSYPVMSADNSSFPPNMWLERTSLYNIIVKSSLQPHDANIFTVQNPLPGSWFAAAYLPNWDQHVQQEGIGHKCQYSLGSIALWSQIFNINLISLSTTTKLSSMERFTYYKFYIPSGIRQFLFQIDGCHFHSSYHFPELQIKANDSISGNGQNTSVPIPCIQYVFLRARALPKFDPVNYDMDTLIDKDSLFRHTEILPYTDSYYYVLIVSEKRVSYNVHIAVKECNIEILGKTFVERFSGLNTEASIQEQAIRMNMTITSGSDSNFLNEVCDCIPIYRLTRIKHSQDFSDTFLLEGKEWFTTWLALSDSSLGESNKGPVGAYFEILPYVDIGGTLSISIHLDELLLNASIPILSVKACIRKSRPPETLCCSSSMSSCGCDPQLTLSVSTKSPKYVDDTLLIPYPEPDKWFISFTTYCHQDGEVVPCTVDEALVSLDIRTQPCVLTKPNTPGSPVLSCGPYGVCQEVHKGQYFYTSCRCKGGYRGWACTDDSDATPEYLLVMTTLLLTLSNVFFVPAIVLAARRRMFTQVFIYSSTMISSTLYHACDQDIYGYCFTRYQVLQFCDFFCSILAFWVTLIALAKSPPKYDSVLYILGAVVIAIGVEYNRTGLMVFVVPFCMGIGIPISVWAYRSFQNKSVIVPTLKTVLLFLPGVLLGAAGLILFAFVETEDNYRYTHSAWHVIIAISLVYLLPKRQKKKMEPISNLSLDTNNTAELAAVNDHHPSSASPVFFITSDLDNLVQEQSR